jgi:hypothetical protein
MKSELSSSFSSTRALFLACCMPAASPGPFHSSSSRAVGRTVADDSSFSMFTLHTYCHLWRWATSNYFHTQILLVTHLWRPDLLVENATLTRQVILKNQTVKIRFFEYKKKTQKKNCWLLPVSLWCDKRYWQCVLLQCTCGNHILQLKIQWEKGEFCFKH